MVINWLKGWLIILLTVSGSLHASQESEVLDDDFLEFLGDWETASGDWIDPEELAAILPQNTSERDSQSKKTDNESSTHGASQNKHYGGNNEHN